MVAPGNPRSADSSLILMPVGKSRLDIILSQHRQTCLKSCCAYGNAYLYRNQQPPIISTADTAAKAAINASRVASRVVDDTASHLQLLVELLVAVLLLFGALTTCSAAAHVHPAAPVKPAEYLTVFNC